MLFFYRLGLLIELKEHSIISEIFPRKALHNVNAIWNSPNDHFGSTLLEAFVVAIKSQVKQQINVSCNLQFKKFSYEAFVDFLVCTRYVHKFGRLSKWRVFADNNNYPAEELWRSWTKNQQD